MFPLNRFVGFVECSVDSIRISCIDVVPGCSYVPYIDGLVQERRYSIAKALELCHLGTNPSTCSGSVHGYRCL